MKRLLATVVAAAALASGPGAFCAPPKEPKDVNREITRLLREMQSALEGGSARALLSLIDSAKFADYRLFEDTVERLLREDSIRAYFRQVDSALPAQDKARTVVEAEMEVSRRDAAGQVERRRQELVVDFERTRRGWRIVNLTPRSYFEPL